MEERNVENPLPEEDVIIVVAGRSGAGKTSLCKTLLGLEKDIPLKAGPDTKVAEFHHIVKNDVRITIVDTPGFVNEHVTDVQQKFDLLIYCLPVDSPCKFHDANPVVMQQLQDMYGKDIWKHCVVAFTFSNNALENAKKNCTEEQGIERYKHFIDEYTTCFQNELYKLNVTKIAAKGYDQPLAQDIITAIPVGDNPENPVLPGLKLHEGSNGWVDEMFLAMIEKCKYNEKLAKYRYGKELAKRIVVNVGAGAVAVGAAVGVILASAGAGAALGTVGGPVGIIVTSIFGGVAGIAAGTGAGFAAAIKFKESVNVACQT